MNYFIDITDRRNVYLKDMLEKKGYRIFAFSSDILVGIVKGDCCIFSPAKKFTIEEVDKFPNSITVFSGNVKPEVSQLFEEKNIAHVNFLAEEDFAVKNAILTAEGVLAIILEKSERSIVKNKVLLLGAGRISKATAILLGKLGIHVAFATYNPVELANSSYYCKKCYYKDEFREHLGEYDIIVNTRPFKFFDEDMISKVAPNTLFIETASVDCLDKEKVTHFTYVLAPGLPQKYCCESAAELMLEKIL